MESAVREIIKNKVSIREVAKCTGISKSSLHRAVNKAKREPTLLNTIQILEIAEYFQKMRKQHYPNIFSLLQKCVTD